LGALLLFLFSGLASSYLYYRSTDTENFNAGALFPGLLYTSVTIIIFAFSKKIYSFKNLLIYYLLMYATYLAAYFLTLCSSWFSFILGNVISGTGAVVTFILTDKYISPLKFSRLKVFIAGGVSFLLVVLWGLTFEKTPVEYLFGLEGSVNTVYGDVFIFWHSIVGATLYVTMKIKNPALLRDPYTE
jgi:hypothetical protein